MTKEVLPYIEHTTGPSGGKPVNHIIPIHECFKNDEPEEDFDIDDLDAWQGKRKGK